MLAVAEHLASHHWGKDNRPIHDGPIYITRVDDGGEYPGIQNEEIGTQLAAPRILGSKCKPDYQQYRSAIGWTDRVDGGVWYEEQPRQPRM
jgi:hypothetical protein